MLTNFVLQDLQQAVSPGDMFYRLPRIRAWFLVLGFHVTYLCSYFSPCTASAHLAGDPLEPFDSNRGVERGGESSPGGYHSFDILHWLNSSAGAGCGAVQRRSGTGEVELTGQRPALEQPIDKSGVKDVAGASGIQSLHLKRGGIVKL